MARRANRGLQANPDDTVYVKVKLNEQDNTRTYPWQKVMDTQGLPMITAPEGVKESPEVDEIEYKAPKEEAQEEKPSRNRKYSFDNSDNLTYNERRALDKITDDMSFGEARELFLDERNRKTASLLTVFERSYQSVKKVTQKAVDLFNALREARDDANQTREEYSTEENIRNLERLLRNRGLLREGSYLARDMQRILDSLRSKRNNGSVAEIPGEYRRMYDKIDEYEKSGKFPIPKGHSIRQGAFSNARSMDELKAEVKEAFPGAKVQESGNFLWTAKGLR